MEEVLLVSIIVVLYKKFDNVYEALDSVFCQTYMNLELIVTDDGSPDFPKKDIEDYILLKKRDNIVNYLILDNKVNVGTVKHSNFAFNKASGKLIKFLAGDDQLYNKTVIENIVKIYKENHFNILATSSISFYPNEFFSHYSPHIETGRYINRVLSDAKQQYKYFVRWKYHEIASGSTMVIDADFFRKMGGFDESYKLWEDGPFIYAVLKKGYKIETAYDLVSVKYGLGGISGSYNEVLAEDQLTLLSRILLDKDFKRDLYSKRCIKFFYLVNKTKYKFIRIFYNLCYLDVYIDHYLYLRRMRIHGTKDKDYFKSLSNT